MRCGKCHPVCKGHAVVSYAALKTGTGRVTDMKSCLELGVGKDSVVHVLPTSDVCHRTLGRIGKMGEEEQLVMSLCS